ncbi:helix-turn-helix transcriptional regulator [Micromonospora sp. NBC_00421]|uniref:helix-turn-helix transcriptional regulator n=1 Tax=Micromonospora sp. NBC_00421 TaxID=2975976 RepID=UPI002E1DDDDD
MTDTLVLHRGVKADTDTRYRLTPAAAQHALRVLGLRRKEDLAEHLGISRSSLFRLFDGNYRISLAQAEQWANLIGWPIRRVFERCDNLSEAA